MNTGQLLSLLFLLLLTISQVYCAEKKEKCTRYSDVQESDYTCGNICAQYLEPCFCGNKRLSKYSPEYCCMDPEDSCRRYFTGITGSSDDPVCSSGRPVPRAQPCHGSCPPDSPSNKTDAQGNVICDYDKRCPYHEDHYMCGDVCAHDRSTCVCGDTTLTSWHTLHYCCLPPGEHCTVTEGIYTKEIVCSKGTAVHKSLPCNGSCFEKTDSIQTDGTCSNKASDKCDYKSRMICGDTCTGSECTCAGTKIYTGRYDNDKTKYCCTPPEDSCDFQCPVF